jgi:hypothetical protein
MDYRLVPAKSTNGAARAPAQAVIETTAEAKPPEA